jgi:hypothetical protein
MEKWYFTLSDNQGGPGCVEVAANNFSEARNKMVENYGIKWAFQYDSIDKVHPLDQRILGVIE